MTANSVAGTYNVAGMTCENCVKHVTTELEEIPGVSRVEVDLVSGGTSKVTVVSDAPIPVEAVAAAVDEAGYTLES